MHSRELKQSTHGSTGTASLGASAPGSAIVGVGAKTLPPSCDDRRCGPSILRASEHRGARAARSTRPREPRKQSHPPYRRLAPAGQHAAGPSLDRVAARCRVHAGVHAVACVSTVRSIDQGQGPPHGPPMLSLVRRVECRNYKWLHPFVAVSALISGKRQPRPALATHLSDDSRALLLIILIFLTLPSFHDAIRRLCVSANRV